MNWKSLRVRVATFYVGMLAAALIVFSAAVYLSVRAFLIHSLERSLSTSAATILTDYVKPLSGKGLSWFENEMSESYPPGITDTFVRVSEASNILFQTGDMKDPPISAPAFLPYAGVGDEPEFRWQRVSSGQQMLVHRLVFRTPEGRAILLETGAPSEPILHILGTLALILLIGTPAIVIVAAIGGYFVITRALQPVVSLTDWAERVGRADLGERLPVIRSGDELERLSLSLNRMIDRLEESLAHNRRFSADASHELRTPLTIIRGELEVLMERADLPPAALDSVHSAFEESHRMSRLVESLMSISRLEGGGESIELQPVDLAEIAQTTLDQMELLAEEKDIVLRWVGDQNIFVLGDAMRLKQVVVNLLDNAIKYTQPKGLVTLSVQPIETNAVLEVSDTGIGIPEDALPLIFERFYRADPTRSRNSGGIGLGLSIVKSICVAHGGTVSVSSVEGSGTTVRVTLPQLQRSLFDGMDENHARARQESSSLPECTGPSKRQPQLG